MKNTERFGIMICLTMPFVHLSLYADNIIWEKDLIQLVELYDMEDTGESGLYERLVELHESPLDVNTATRDELLELPFLSPSQIEELHVYIFNHGPMLSIAELMLVPGFDYNTRMYASEFLYVASSPAELGRKKGRSVRYGRHSLMTQSHIPFYTRSGFQYHSPEELLKYPNRQYLGSRFSKMALRYSYKNGDRFKMGLSLDSDAGEPLFSYPNSGFDFVSPYIEVSKVGALKKVIIGNFKISSGLGLTSSSLYGLGKGVVASSLYRWADVLKAHSGISESGYFSGLGATLGMGAFDLTLAFADTPRDATLTGDEIKSLKTDGYHRTPLEYSKRANTLERTLYANTQYKTIKSSIGADVMFNSFDRPFAVSNIEYLRYNPVGDSFYAGSAYYLHRNKSFSLAGQFALSGNMNSAPAMAYIGMLNYKISDSFRAYFIIRSYQKGYHSFHSSSFSDGSLVRNEQGMYIGLDKNISYFTFNWYADLFRFPFATYSASVPSQGFDTQVTAEYFKHRSNKYSVRFRLKSKQEDGTAGGLVSRNSLSFRAIWDSSPVKSISNRLQFNAVYINIPESKNSTGFALSGKTDFTPPKANYSLHISASLFLTSDYDGRITIYEKGLLYEYNYLSLYGKGFAAALVFQYEFARNISILIKAGSIKYLDRSSISSSQQQINQSHKEDLAVQLKFSF